MLTFNSTLIHGTHGPVLAGRPALQVARTKFMGLKGSSEIVGESGARPIATQIWLHHASYTTAAHISAALKTLDQMVGVHGTLVVSGTINRTFPACTFEGFEPGELGILPDISLAVGGSWWIAGVLRWTQLTVWDAGQT